MISSNNALVESGTLNTWFCPKFLGNKYGNASGDCALRTLRRSEGEGTGDEDEGVMIVVGCAEGEGCAVVADDLVGAGENADRADFSREGSGGISDCVLEVVEETVSVDISLREARRPEERRWDERTSISSRRR